MGMDEDKHKAPAHPRLHPLSLQAMGLFPSFPNVITMIRCGPLRFILIDDQAKTGGGGTAGSSMLRPITFSFLRSESTA